jgi:L-fuconolactonase
VLFDCHAHLIAGDPVRYPSVPQDGKPAARELEEPMTAERLLSEMDRNDVARAVAVQRASIYGYDNSYVCDSAAKYPDRLVAVCAIDAVDPRGPEHVRHWVRERGAVGIRLMELVKGSDLSWLASPQALEVWHAAHELQVPVCVHFFRWNREAGLTALKRILDSLSRVTVVIDHFSNMVWQSGPPDYGVDQPLLRVAEFPNVYTKFTTLPLGQLEKEGVAAVPIMARVIETFGARRVMWGSDITQSPGTYAYMVGLANRAVAALDETQRNQVLHGSVNDVYGRKR